MIKRQSLIQDSELLKEQARKRTGKLEQQEMREIIVATYGEEREKELASGLEDWLLATGGVIDEAIKTGGLSKAGQRWFQGLVLGHSMEPGAFLSSIPYEILVSMVQCANHLAGSEQQRKEWQMKGGSNSSFANRTANGATEEEIKHTRDANQRNSSNGGGVAGNKFAVGNSGNKVGNPTGAAPTAQEKCVWKCMQGCGQSDGRDGFALPGIPEKIKPIKGGIVHIKHPKRGGQRHASLNFAIAEPDDPACVCEAANQLLRAFDALSTHSVGAVQAAGMQISTSLENFTERSDVQDYPPFLDKCDLVREDVTGGELFFRVKAPSPGHD